MINSTENQYRINVIFVIGIRDIHVPVVSLLVRHLLEYLARLTEY